MAKKGPKPNEDEEFSENQRRGQTRKIISEETGITVSIGLIVAVVGAMFALAGSLMYAAYSYAGLVFQVDALKGDVADIKEKVEGPAFTELLLNYEKGLKQYKSESKADSVMTTNRVR